MPSRGNWRYARPARYCGSCQSSQYADQRPGRSTFTHSKCAANSNVTSTSSNAGAFHPLVRNERCKIIVWLAQLMLTLLHISDLHFGPYYVPHVGEALLRSALAAARRDHRQRRLHAAGQEGEYAAAREYLDRLPSGCRWWSARQPRRAAVPRLGADSSAARIYRKHIRRELNSVLQLDGRVIVSLDSTAPLTAITNGRIRREQLGVLPRGFRAVPERC